MFPAQREPGARNLWKTLDQQLRCRTAYDSARSGSACTSSSHAPPTQDRVHLRATRGAPGRKVEFIYERAARSPSVLKVEEGPEWSEAPMTLQAAEVTSVSANGPRGC